MHSLLMRRTQSARNLINSSSAPTAADALIVAALLTVWPGEAHASLSIYVGRNLTKEGSVLLAGFGDEPSSHWLTLAPRRQYPVGTTIKVGGTSQANFPG